MRTSCLQITLPHMVHAQVHHLVLNVAMQIAAVDTPGDCTVQSSSGAAPPPRAAIINYG